MSSPEKKKSSTHSRRQSLLNLFHRSRRVAAESRESGAESPPLAVQGGSALRDPISDYENISPPLIIPEGVVEKRPDTSSFIRKMTRFFAKRKSAQDDSVLVVTSNADDSDGVQEAEETLPAGVLEEADEEDLDDSSWQPPESWAVMDPTRASQASEVPLDTANMVVLQVFKPDHRSRSVPDVGLDDDEEERRYANLTILCPIDADTKYICGMLARRFLSSRESARFWLYLQHQGTERMLQAAEQPAKIQLALFQQIGFNETDDLNNLGREDNRYLLRLVYRELPPESIPRRQNITEEGATDTGTRRSHINARTALLANQNLSVVPVAVFETAATQESIDFSRNCLLRLPADLFESLVKLRILHLRGNFLRELPPAVLLAHSITHLTLSQNELEGGALRPLVQLPNLKWLDLAGNRLRFLPGELASLTYLTHLILSCNQLEEIPQCCFSYHQLRQLDISFNRLTCIPDAIQELLLLSQLMVAGNCITRISPAIEKLKFLKSVNIRGNQVNEMDGLLWCDSLNELHADHNAVYSLKNPKWSCLSYLALSNNKLTSMEFSFQLRACQFVDVSKCQITLLPDDLFDSLPALTTLHLDFNELSKLPDSISTLEQLETLSASNNRIASLSHINFGQLKALRVLDLHANNIESVPEDIWQLPAISRLNLSSNLLSRFPMPPVSVEAPPMARNLEKLLLAENRLKDDVIDAIQCLAELKYLNLSHNDLYDIADGFRPLSKLQFLFLSSNNLTSLPEDIDKLKALRQLFINGNKLQSLPAELGKCAHLEVFDAAANNLKYNINNWPYDWNWHWNIDLRSLDLSDNRKLEIKPTAVSATSSVRQSFSALKNQEESEFRTLLKLNYLNVTNVSSSPNCLPQESTSLRVRTTVPLASKDDPKTVEAFLSPPEEPEIPPVGVAEWCGCRPETKGATPWMHASPSFNIFDFQCRRYLGHTKDHLIGLFDGKDSPLVSGFLYDSFDNFLHAELHKLAADEPVANAIRRAFLWASGDIANCRHHSPHAACLSILYTMDQTMYAANVGDSVTVLSRNGSAVVLSTRHHAWNREEAQRVQSVGGTINLFGLVNDESPLTRLIGAHHLLPAVNANPTIRVHELTEQCEFVVLATGAVFHFVSPQIAIDIVRTCKDDYNGAARKLRDLVISHGCVDPFSVLVVGLQEMFASSSGARNKDGRQRRRRGFQQESAADLTINRLDAEISPPEGEMAIVFTDIKDHTLLWQAFPAPMRVAIRIHNTIMRRLMRICHGYEVKNDGDSFMAAFTSSVGALRWMVLCQKELLEAEWPQEILDSAGLGPVFDAADPSKMLFRGLSVRMGAHFGTPFCREKDPTSNRYDYLGPAVIAASRLEGHARGGQILISDAFYQKIADSPYFMAECADVPMGLLQLKGLETPEHARAVYPKSLLGRHGLPQ